MKTCVPLVVMLAFLPTVAARVTESWTERRMFNEAELVVIATVIATKDTAEGTALIDMQPFTKVVGVETEFTVCLVLKGSRDITHLTLHHYRLDEEESMNGPALVTFPPGKHPSYLLFLKKEKEGKYMPLAGQSDPATTAVLRLQGATGPRIGAPEPAVVPCGIGTSKAPAQSDSYPGKQWSYVEMCEKADFVAIAEWVSTKETKQRATLTDSGTPTQVIGVTTEFDLNLVLKGGADGAPINLRHYKFQNEDDYFRPYAPKLLKVLEPVERQGISYPGGGRFLLFLRKEDEGGYAPITGQTDPAVLSTLQLKPAFD